MLIALKNNSIIIEIADEIKEAHLLDNSGNIDEDLFVSGEYYLDKTTIFPLIPDIVSTFTSLTVGLISLLKKEDLVENLNQTNKLKINDLINDKKLMLSLELYTKLPKYNDKTQFFDLITILEILKPKYDISDKTKEYLKDIKDFIKSIRDERCEKNSEEYKEMNRYLSNMKHWDEKSINKSLQLY